jgi:hypothetical protein
VSFDGRICQGISVLAAVVDGGSFVKAAELIGVTGSGVSDRPAGDLALCTVARSQHTIDHRITADIEAGGWDRSSTVSGKTSDQFLNTFCADFFSGKSRRPVQGGASKIDLRMPRASE